MLPHHRHAVPIGWAGWAILCVLLILVPAACHVSQAAPVAQARYLLQLSEAECAQLGRLARAIGVARDAGAARQRVVDEAQRQLENLDAPAALRRLVLGEIRRVYTSALSIDVLEMDAYARCLRGPAAREEP